MTDEQVNAELQEAGYDLEQVGLCGERLAKALTENRKLSERIKKLESALRHCWAAMSRHDDGNLVESPAVCGRSFEAERAEARILSGIDPVSEEAQRALEPLGLCDRCDAWVYPLYDKHIGDTMVCQECFEDENYEGILRGERR